MAIFPELSEEAQEVMEACVNSLGSKTKSHLQRRVTLDAIEMLIGHEPSQEVMQECVEAGWLRELDSNSYYVVEFDVI